MATMLHSSMLNSSLADLTTAQLRRAVAIKERIDVLNNELLALLGASESKSTGRGRPKMSSIIRRGAAVPQPTKMERRKFSAGARAKMRAAAKARWAAAKASGRSRL